MVLIKGWGLTVRRNVLFVRRNVLFVRPVILSSNEKLVCSKDITWAHEVLYFLYYNYSAAIFYVAERKPI